MSYSKVKGKLIFNMWAFVIFLLVPFTVFSSEFLRLSFDNGLKVIIAERHRRNLVACQIWVKVGSAYEREGEYGISHFIEHMIFKPTLNYPQGVASIVESFGGTINAFTSVEYTVYHFVVMKEGFKESFKALADSVLNPLFSESEVEKERQVILEEIKRGYDDPQKRFSLRLWKEAFLDHPYGRPVIGFEETVSSFKRDDLARFHQRWYIPSRMSVVIVGDIDPSEAVQLVKETFGHLKEQEKKETSEMSLSLKPQKEEVRVFYEWGSERELLTLAWIIPGISSPLNEAFDLLSEVLGGGRASRLVKALKEEGKLVISLETNSVRLGQGGLFFVRMVPNTKDYARLIEETMRVLQKASSEGFSDEELDRAKKAFFASSFYQRESFDDEAFRLGFFETLFGNAKEADSYLEKIKGLSEKELRKVLSEVLASPPLVGVLGSRRLEISLEESIKELFSPFKRVTFPNGARLILVEDRSLPIVAVNVAFPGGSLYESKEKAGLSRVLANSITRGTKKRSSIQVAEELERMGAILEGFSTREILGLRGKVLSSDFPRFLDLVEEILKYPAFPEDQVEKAKAEQLEALKRQKEILTVWTLHNFRSEFFGDHPYGFNPLGSSETLLNISRKDVVRYWKSRFDPSRMVIVVVGDVDWLYLQKLMFEKFGKLRTKKQKVLLEIPKPIFKGPFCKELKREGINQSHLIIGSLGPSFGASEYYPFSVLSAILEGQGGKIFKRLREDLALGYETFFFYTPYKEAGLWGAYVATSPNRTKEAMEALQGLFSDLRSINEEEIEKAKKYLLGNFEISLQDYLSLCDEILRAELLGVGSTYVQSFPQKIKGVRLEDVRRVIELYCDPNKMSILVVNPS